MLSFIFYNCKCKLGFIVLFIFLGTDIKSVDNFGRTPITLAKSRLKFLVEDKTYSSQRVKDEALEVLITHNYFNLY